MTSAAKRAVNRLNARSSTGPKSACGRAHSSRNARKHGLSVSVVVDPRLSKEIEALATEFAGPASNAEIDQLAREIAIAQIEVNRVRAARYQLLFEAMNDPEWDTDANRRAKDRAVIRSLRTAGPFTPMSQELAEFVYSCPRGPEKFALMLESRLHEISILDRYERRALSKRKFAIRALDHARRRSR